MTKFDKNIKSPDLSGLEYNNIDGKIVKTRQNKICGVISSTENIEYYKGGIVKDIGSKTKEEQIAHNLYGVFREFDDENVDYIFSESFKTPKMGMAIMNRLLKAAGYNIIKV